MKKDYLSGKMKTVIGDRIILHTIKDHPTMTQTQLRRIFCHLYHRLYHQKDSFFEEAKKEVMR